MAKKLGVLLHVASLKSEYGVGDFGKSAYDFIDLLHKNKINIWQILPLGETNEYNCPYASLCYFSYDTMFVSPEDLIERKLIDQKELKALKKLSHTVKVEYQTVKKEKRKLFEIAYKNITDDLFKEVEKTFKTNEQVKKYAIYKSLGDTFGKDWRVFPFDINDEKNPEYTKYVSENYANILKYVFFQYILRQQWRKVMEYASKHKVTILGDLPVYPDKNSLDVYNNYQLFKLDKQKNPTVFGGVPADDFCKEGQNWGTCVYDWNKMSKDGYKFMVSKINDILSDFDMLRIDHFIGYVKHWEVSAKDNDPLKGKWVKSGDKEFFEELFKVVAKKRIVVEDLGVNLAEVRDTMKKFDLKGMCVLQMILENETNLRYLPENVTKNCLYYLGTHDNDTFVGFLQSLSSEKKKRFLQLVGINQKNDKKICVECIKKMLASKSDIIILQMQDYLLQDGKSRMNVPGRAENCWDYRVPYKYEKRFQKNLAKILK